MFLPPLFAGGLEDALLLGIGAGAAFFCVFFSGLGTFFTLLHAVKNPKRISIVCSQIKNFERPMVVVTGTCWVGPSAGAQAEVGEHTAPRSEDLLTDHASSCFRAYRQLRNDVGV